MEENLSYRRQVPDFSFAGCSLRSRNSLKVCDDTGRNSPGSPAVERMTQAQTQTETENPAALPTIRLERKHPLAIRWMHWINFPVLFTMIWSGILIYWNDSDNAYRHPHAIYRIGLGKLTLIRLFPDWFYKWLNVPYHVTQGLGYHFFF